MVNAKARLPAVLFQAPNTIGLGHINRLAAIALAMREDRPHVACALAIDGSDHGLLESLGLPWMSLPRASPVAAGRDWGGWPGDARARLFADLSQAMLKRMQPTAVVFDSLPHAQFLLAVRDQQIPFCFVARKMKTNTYVSALKSVLNHAAAIIVPHTRDEFALPRQWDAKTHYVGVIVRRQRAVAPGSDLEKLPPPRVVITGGGGGYPGTADFYNLAVEACQQARKDFPTLSALLVAGPLFHEWGRLRLSGTTVLSSHWDMLGLYGRASLVICQAGYNTVAEVLESGAAAISVPAPRTFDDQAERAHGAAAHHPRFHTMEHSTAGALAVRISSVLAADAEGRVANAAGQATDGARRAARVVADLAAAQG